jgi:hypothetical protein
VSEYFHINKGITILDAERALDGAREKYEEIEESCIIKIDKFKKHKYFEISGKYNDGLRYEIIGLDRSWGDEVNVNTIDRRHCG